MIAQAKRSLKKNKFKIPVKLSLTEFPYDQEPSSHILKGCSHRFLGVFILFAVSQ